MTTDKTSFSNKIGRNRTNFKFGLILTNQYFEIYKIYRFLLKIVLTSYDIHEIVNNRFNESLNFK